MNVEIEECISKNVSWPQLPTHVKQVSSDFALSVSVTVIFAQFVYLCVSIFSYSVIRKRNMNV